MNFFRISINIFIAGLPIITLISCNSSPPVTSQLPPCVESDCNCSDFRTQQEAQQVLESFQGDPHGLDRDGNGRACESLPNVSSTPSDTPIASIHLKYGNPSRANANDPNNLLLLKPQFAIGYNCSKNSLSWASWQLTREWLGNVKRANNFRPDESLPPDCYKVHPRDYRGSEYDRGHGGPASADRDRNEEDNSATFLMTNIIPQAPQNNRGVWQQLEKHLRKLAQQGKELYVVAGGEGSQGTIGNGVNIPKFTWKAVLILDKGVPESMLAVRMPNDKTVAGTDWKDWKVTVDMLEVSTGYDLFSELPNKLENNLEALNGQ